MGSWLFAVEKSQFGQESRPRSEFFRKLFTNFTEKEWGPTLNMITPFYIVINNIIIYYSVKSELFRLHNINIWPAVSGLTFLENTMDPDQMASDESIWSGSTLFPLCLEVHTYNWISAC